ncbi:MAG TPA: DUF3822 family protein [Bacteroidaceae bacterium]|nr:DUF3822 family protein [Bacteroidaceae bacterium]
MVAFEPNQKYSLSIRIFVDGFSFSIYCPLLGSRPIHTQYVSVDTTLSVAVNLKKLYQEEICLRHDFVNVVVYMEMGRWTIVPSSMWISHEKLTYFYQNLPVRDNEVVLRDHVSNLEMEVVHAVDKTLLEELRAYYGEALCVHAVSSLLLSSFVSQVSHSNRFALFVVLQGEYLDFYAIKKGGLELTNRVYAPVVSDCIYYTLYIWKILGYQQLSDSLIIVDMSNRDKTTQLLNVQVTMQDVVTNLRQYIKHVGVVTSPVLDWDEYIRMNQ